MSASKLLKIAGYAAASLAVLLLLAIVTVYVISNHKLRRRHPIQVAGLPIPSDAAALARGRHIVETRGCAECHGADFGGHTVIDDPAMGVIAAPNLTRGAGGLPPDYGSVDFVRAIRHGVARDGRGLVLMPSADYTSWTDEDLAAAIAYVMSRPPVDRPSGPVSPGPLARVLLVAGQIRIAADDIDHAAPRPASISPSVSVAYGQYLAASCIGCHGPNLSGGRIPGAPPSWPAAANLTPASVRVSRWTEAQFAQVLRTRRRPDGTPLDPVMPGTFGHLSNLEINALWTYLRSLPPAATGVR